MSIQSQSRNKNVLITGGDGDLAKELIEELRASFNCYSPSRQELNVSNIVSVDAYFKDKDFDIIVNMAGTLHSAEIIDSVPELWIRDIEVNLIGTYLVTRTALANNQSTKIINIASTAAYNSYSDWTSYCAAKSGVIKISEGLCKSGYHVVTMCPGAIDTKIRDGLNIYNPNVMSIADGVKPIVDAVYECFESGTIFLYRKGGSEFISGGYI